MSPTRPVSPRNRTGSVAEFDDARGIGVIEDARGGRWFFHCTAIADRSRTIEVGVPVRFWLTAAHCGRWEATDIEPA